MAACDWSRDQGGQSVCDWGGGIENRDKKERETQRLRLDAMKEREREREREREL